VDIMAPFPCEEATIAQLRDGLQQGRFSVVELVTWYLARIEAIDRAGPALRSVIEVNPEAHDIAAVLDAEQAAGSRRGPLHGIPVLLKDNIDTDDQLRTTAGSLALLQGRPKRDAFVAAQLRRAGAVILGKANLSEWANFRSTRSSSGWSARGGQALNPYALDRTPCGSSSGSATAVAANLAAGSVGTETDGSILCPAAMSGVVGIKPTVGLTSRSGVIPVSHSQDTVGPFGRTVADAALLLGALAGIDPRDPATAASHGRAAADYSVFLDAEGLRGARLGVPRTLYFGYSAPADAAAEQALRVIREAGATLVDPADIPTARLMKESRGELEVLLYECKAGLNAYLAQRGPEDAVHSLEELIEFNRVHAAEEMPYFGQETLEMAQAKGPLSEQAYRETLETNRRLSRQEGIDAVLDEHRLDALVLPTSGVPWKIDHLCGDHHGGGSSSHPAALAGYPAITVPAGWYQGLPLGITFLGRAFSEPVLIKLAHAYEQATHCRRVPTYPATVG